MVAIYLRLRTSHFYPTAVCMVGIEKGETGDCDSYRHVYLYCLGKFLKES